MPLRAHGARACVRGCAAATAATSATIAAAAAATSGSLRRHHRPPPLMCAHKCERERKRVSADGCVDVSTVCACARAHAC
eukprot:15456354-Alexandrium_andersonii.AAC.1